LQTRGVHGSSIVTGGQICMDHWLRRDDLRVAGQVQFP
jgi:hypothetical protein